MSTRILIVLVVVIVALAVVAVVLGSDRPAGKAGRDQERERAKADKPAYTGWLARAFGGLAPGFDLRDLTVAGATLTERRLVLALNQQVTFTVAARPEADRNSCRSLTLALIAPQATGPLPPALVIDSCALAPPLPEDFDPPAGQLLPNAKLEPDPVTKRIDPRKYGECAIPVFRGGARIVLTAKRACTVEIR
jgi:hypothetical protein